MYVFIIYLFGDLHSSGWRIMQCCTTGVRDRRFEAVRAGCWYTTAMWCIIELRAIRRCVERRCWVFQRAREGFRTLTDFQIESTRFRQRPRLIIFTRWMIKKIEKCICVCFVLLWPFTLSTVSISLWSQTFYFNIRIAIIPVSVVRKHKETFVIKKKSLKKNGT